MSRRPEEPILCPSAQPESGARIFGVQTATAAGRRVGYLTETQPIRPDLLALSGQGAPTETLRIASPCMGGGCAHFDGATCRLAARVAQLLDPVVAGLPRCAIRPTCRWFRQEGRAACIRCPQVVTDAREATPLQLEVAGMAAMPAGAKRDGTNFLAAAGNAP